MGHNPRAFLGYSFTEPKSLANVRLDRKIDALARCLQSDKVLGVRAFPLRFYKFGHIYNLKELFLAKSFEKTAAESELNCSVRELSSPWIMIRIPL